MTTTNVSNRRTRLQAIALGSAGLVAGAVIALSGAASAADNSTPTPTATSGTQSVPAAPQAGQPGQPGQQPPAGMQGAPKGVPGGADPVRSDEKAVTADQKATLTAAAEKAVPGGTVVRVETDAGDATYEAHMTKADGTAVTVKFDDKLAVTAVEDGMGKGDPAPQGAPQGGPQGGPQGAPGAGAATSGATA